MGGSAAAAVDDGGRAPHALVTMGLIECARGGTSAAVDPTRLPETKGLGCKALLVGPRDPKMVL